MTTKSLSEVRTDVDTYLASLGFAVHRREIYRLPMPVDRSGYLQVEVRVASARTTRVAVERWHCLDAPEEAADWLEVHVWPAVHRYANRPPRRGTFLPSGGSFTNTCVLTEEVVDVLRAWIPQEISWQHLALSRDWASTSTSATPS